ncbi:hypothetical protein D3C76_1767180 [compost metagenome]
MQGQRFLQQLGELLTVAVQDAGIHGLQGLDQLLAGSSVEFLDGLFFHHSVDALDAGLEVQL